MGIDKTKIKQTVEFSYQKQFEDPQYQPLVYDIKVFVTQQYGPTIAIKRSEEEQYQTFYPAQMFTQISTYLQQRKGVQLRKSYQTSNLNKTQINQVNSSGQKLQLPRVTKQESGQQKINSLPKKKIGTEPYRVDGDPMESFNGNDNQTQNFTENHLEQGYDEQLSDISSDDIATTGRMSDEDTQIAKQWQARKKTIKQSPQRRLRKLEDKIDPDYKPIKYNSKIMSQQMINAADKKSK